MAEMMGQNPYYGYANLRPELYTMSPDSQALMAEATNPSNLMSLDEYMKLGLDQSRNYINQIATPEIQSQLALQGMEGSGALPESIAKATAQIGLPFVQSIPQFGVARTQQAQGMLGMSDMPRQLRLEDFLRSQGVVTTGFTGMPYTPGSQITGATRQPSIFENVFGTGSATGSFSGLGTFGGANQFN